MKMRILFNTGLLICEFIASGILTIMKYITEFHINCIRNRIIQIDFPFTCLSTKLFALSLANFKRPLTARSGESSMKTHGMLPE
jgi:hypothetical protein